MAHLEYLHYFQEIYAVDVILRAKEQNDLPTKESNALYNPQARLWFSVPFAQAYYNEELKELFERMVKAMGLSLQQVGLFFQHQWPREKSEDHVLLILDEDWVGPKMGEWKSEAARSTLKTYSLSTLQKNIEAKKEAWGHLKSVLPYLHRTEVGI